MIKTVKTCCLNNRWDLSLCIADSVTQKKCMGNQKPEWPDAIQLPNLCGKHWQTQQSTILDVLIHNRLEGCMSERACLPNSSYLVGCGTFLLSCLWFDLPNELIPNNYVL